PPRQTCPLLCRVGTAHPCRVAGCTLGNEPWISAETFIRPDRLSVNADARSSGRGRALAGKLLSQGSYATRCWCRPLVAGRKRRQRFPLCGGCWNRRSSPGGCSWHVRRRRLVLTPPLRTAGIRSVPGPTCSEVGRCKIAIRTTSCRLDRSACEELRPDRQTL